MLELTTAAEARANAIIRPAAAPVATPPGADPDAGSAEGGLFDAVVDSINPLQHLPVVGPVYRAVSNDAISPVARMAGGWLFGGPAGLGISAASAFVEMVTGQDPGEMVLGWLTGDDAEKNVAKAAGKTPATPTSDGPLLGEVDKRSGANAAMLAQAEDERYAGVGASEAVVGWSSNIWAQRALSEAAGKYDATNTLSEKSKGKADGGRFERVI